MSGELAHQHTLGCSDGSDNKVPEYQSTSVHLTTHRLLIVPDSNAPSSSTAQTLNLQMSLRYVRQTELYNGFMRSSPKVTLSLGPSPAAPLPDQQSEVQTSWTCGVCGFVNDIKGFNGTAGAKCGLCGVGFATARSISTPVMRTASPAPTSRRSQDESRSASALTSTSSLMTTTATATAISTVDPARTPAAVPVPTEIACPACTFLNHPSLTSCEICSTPLPKRLSVQPERQLPTPTLYSPSTTGVTNPSRMDVARLSFRKGGSSEAYRRLKNVLSDKAWERVSLTVGSAQAARPGAVLTPGCYNERKSDFSCCERLRNAQTQRRDRYAIRDPIVISADAQMASCKPCLSTQSIRRTT